MTDEHNEGGCIVVGVEDSELSDAAVEVAVRLGRERDLPVIPVHAGDLPLGWWDYVGYEDLARGREATIERLTHRLAAAGLDPGPVTEQLRIVPGPPTEALLAEARSRGAQLIVVGRHRRKGVAHFFGDTARGVLLSAECPVWVQSGAPRAIERILLAFDPKDEGREVLALAREEARIHGAELHILNCFVPPEMGTVLGYPVPLPPGVVLSARDRAEQLLRELVNSFDWEGVPHETIFVDSRPVDEVLERSADVDLILLGSSHAGRLRRVLLGSVTVGVLRKAEIPVLALRPRAP